MSSDKVQKLNYLWHIMGIKLKQEMANKKYHSLFGVSMVELSILQAIEKNPNNILKDICLELGLSKSTLTSAINRLETKGYIIKNKIETDKRAYCLELTKRGIQAQKEHIEIEYTVFNQVLCQLQNHESDILIKLLSKALEES